MTAMIDAATALLAGPFVAGMALIGTFAVAYVARAERQRRERRNSVPLDVWLATTEEPTDA